MGMEAHLPVRVMSTLDTPVNAVNNTGGWISGTPANLAASGSTTALFDLGPNWAQYTYAYVCVRPAGPSTGLGNFLAYGRDDAVNAANVAKALSSPSTTIGNILFITSILTTNGAGGFFLRPMGRYVVISFGNSDASNAQGAAASLSLAAYPN